MGTAGGAAIQCVTQRARVKCVVLDKPSDARLRNQASVTEQNVRKRLICVCPYLSRVITALKKTYTPKGVLFGSVEISTKLCPGVNV